MFRAKVHCLQILNLEPRKTSVESRQNVLSSDLQSSKLYIIILFLKCLYIFANHQSAGNDAGSPNSAGRRSLFKRDVDRWSLLSLSKNIKCLLSPTFSEKSLKTDLC